MEFYSIEKDNVLDKYIVWENHQNYRIEKYRGTKTNCSSYIKRKQKRKNTKKLK